jgi:hypothetical protein
LQAASCGRCLSPLHVGVGGRYPGKVQAIRSGHRGHADLPRRVPERRLGADLRRDPIQSRTATILAICSKYIYRKFEILNSWEDRFPEQFFVRKYTFPTKEDGSPDISLILKALDLKEKQKEEMHALYRNNPFSATTFAKFADAGLLESLSHLASEGTLPIRCCKGTAEELEQAARAFANPGMIVIDPSALATLFFSGQYEHLQLLPGKCVVCESALEEYLELQKKFANAAHGFAGKFKGKYLFQENDPQERQRQEQRLAKFLGKIRSLATMKSGENLAGVSPERREELISLFGQPTAESIAEAASTGAVLWTDDIAVAEVARERDRVEKRVWSSALAFGSPKSRFILALMRTPAIQSSRPQWLPPERLGRGPE